MQVSNYVRTQLHACILMRTISDIIVVDAWNRKMHNNEYKIGGSRYQTMLTYFHCKPYHLGNEAIIECLGYCDERTNDTYMYAGKLDYNNLYAATYK